MLQQGFAAGVCRGAHLFLRMHFLRDVRRYGAARYMPELRRRVGGAAAAAGGEAGEIPGLDRARL